MLRVVVDQDNGEIGQAVNHHEGFGTISKDERPSSLLHAEFQDLPLCVLVRLVILPELAGRVEIEVQLFFEPGQALSAFGGSLTIVTNLL